MSDETERADDATLQADDEIARAKQAAWQLGFDHGIAGLAIDCPKDYDGFSYVHGFIAGKTEWRGAAVMVHLAAIQQLADERALAVAQMESATFPAAEAA